MRLLAPLAVAVCVVGCAASPPPASPRASRATSAPTVPTPSPLVARRGDVTDDLHGTRVADPYRWLEDGASPEVAAWTAAQNAHTRATLDAWPGRAALRARLDELMSVGSVESPEPRPIGAGRHRYFFRRRTGQQNQPVLWVRDGLDGPERPLVDPNALSDAGAVSLDWWFPSNDGRLLAYGTSTHGDEESVLRVRDVATGRDLDDAIARVRHASLAWRPDGSGFWYTRFPARGSVPDGEEHYHRAVYFHRLGDPPAADALVFGEGRAMTDSPSVQVSPSGRWLLVTVWQGWTKSELHLRDLASPGAPFVPLTQGIAARFDATVSDDALHVRTDDGAPRFRLFTVDLRAPSRERWRERVPEGDDALAGFAVAGRDLVLRYLHEATARLVRLGPDGVAHDVALPFVGAAQTTTAHVHGREVFWDLASFASPPRVLRLDLATSAVTTFAEVPSPVDPAGFAVERRRARSRDGTLVPYFLVQRAGATRTGVAPTVLTGYGGFGIDVVPTFQRGALALLEQGGALAVANLRGGGERGEAWHRAGMLGEKQNVFDDAAAVAEDLIADRVTDRDHLAVLGRSNGGLLVGALVTQRPELFRAAVAGVPLLDMLRYQRFLIAKLWVAEYGSADDAAQFPWLHAYSPYHRVRAGTRYPAVLLSAATGDARVDPMHARKMAAALQAATSSDRPILLRVEGEAGHGVGKPLAKAIDEAADTWGFLFSQLGVTLGPGGSR